MAKYRRTLLQGGIGGIVFSISGCVEIDIGGGQGNSNAESGDDERSDDDEVRATPQVDFDMVQKDGKVVFRHRAGDSIRAGRLDIRGAVADGGLGDQQGAITVGDSIPAELGEAAAGDTVQLVWESTSRDVEEVLAEHTASG